MSPQSSTRSPRQGTGTGPLPIAGDRRKTRTRTQRRRRANGEGTIYQVKSGRSAGLWRCAVQLPNGKRRTFSGKSHDEVEAKLLDARHAVAHHRPPAPARTRTVGAYLADWIEGQRPHLRPLTWSSYEGYVRNHIVPSVGRVKLADLQPEDVERLHRECTARGLSARSVRYVHTILNKALKQADRRREVPRNVAALARPPKSVRPKVKPFEPAEAARFLEVVRGEPLEALYVATLGLGLRRGEVLGLRWSDIDWSARQVRVAGQLQRIGGKLVWQPPKAADSIAVIDAPNFVLEALRAHRDRQLLRRANHETEYVFTGAWGGPLDPDGVSHGFARLLERHGLRHTRFHDLRHATASLLLARGVPMWQVSKILRHSSIAITSDSYSHLYAETSRAAADIMNAFLEQAR
jgi:integrase